MRLGALEAGGTKMVCAIGNEHGEIEKQISLPTETPKITLPKLADFFRENHEFRAVQGHITSTAAIYLPIAKERMCR